jgi:uncharacterized CHY-type Zn-finger protein
MSGNTPRHWHITRDIKPRGECAACDDYWRMYDCSDDEIPSTKTVTHIGHPPSAAGDSR